MKLKEWTLATLVKFIKGWVNVKWVSLVLLTLVWLMAKHKICSISFIMPVFYYRDKIHNTVM